mmetsp:Transcript_14185/g.38431  ORF Transcript_14185/g.38431 Transcript_14185/m.38431 type:complete len:503 (+) Transcript_14185:82-1590(+)|eukprot:CAMPEP_0202377216 /NCGR_PEP_ID=MMETSP1127-20130417/8569_1 /ASSEMBLY_ACC=CAM_ASM_000462 /TAXON_ID=3047 /ORGANISM="Dunaliella tertiolecta, Strain CCMP1320" /LENGTH=502 /DNA_ID=CAMNT_0048975183 /DNA_START=33 /DNA_END=1541 /DNA_ORIENTATION=+
MNEDKEGRQHGVPSSRFAATCRSTGDAKQHAKMTIVSALGLLGQQRKTLKRNITIAGMGPKAGHSRVPSMLFDIEMEGEKDMEGSDGSKESVLDLHTAETIYLCLLPGSEEEGKLREDVEQAAQGCIFTDSPADDTHQLASRLSPLYPDMRVRTALGGGEGRSCLRNLRHTFLTVQLSGRSFVIDLAFKEQFIIAKPTERYAVLLDCLPRVHVAEENAVEPLVRFLCKEMALAFQQQATQLPPWRYADSMMSKWRPRRSLDTPADALETPPSSSGPSSTEHLLGPDVSHLLAQQQLLRQQLFQTSHAPDTQQLQQQQLPPIHPHNTQQGVTNALCLATEAVQQQQQHCEGGFHDGRGRAGAPAGDAAAEDATAAALDQQAQAHPSDNQAQVRAHSELPVGLMEGMRGDLGDLSTRPSPPDLVEGMQGLQARPVCEMDSSVDNRMLTSRRQAGDDTCKPLQLQDQSHFAVWPPASVTGSSGSRIHPVNWEPQMVIVGGDFSSL